ncbi:hypothetical protein NQ315_009172 [Exocentrus adspersus]|uniref:Uncharacterized protein n=1 Tax=Exocentrus adspersus TaxID=1586481 RepID=A0AAV8WGI9_9CUCU|nr:hypothetical protein NQ315_009172 [Exocentrus adspersus]
MDPRAFNSENEPFRRQLHVARLAYPQSLLEILDGLGGRVLSMMFLHRYCTFQRNEPCSLPAIVEMIAAFMKKKPEEVALATSFNAMKFDQNFCHVLQKDNRLSIQSRRNGHRIGISPTDTLIAFWNLYETPFRGNHDSGNK